MATGRKRFSFVNALGGACVVWALAACGGGGKGDPDAGDAIDAAPPVTSVSISVSEGGTPLAAINVVLNDASGELLESAVTGADGSYVFSEVASGSSVSAYLEVDGEPQLSTVFGVEPGDALVFEQPAALADFAAMVQFTLAVQAGAVTYEVQAGCGQNAITPAILSSVNVAEQCVQNGQVSLLATAFDAGGVPIAFATIEDLAIANGETKSTAFPAWSAAPPAALVSLAGVDVTADTALLFVAYVRGDTAYIGSRKTEMPPAASSVSVSVVAPPSDFYDAWLMFGAYTKVLAPGNGSLVQLTARQPGVVAATPYSLTDQGMPVVASVAQAWPAAGLRPQLTMTLASPSNELAASAVTGDINFGTHEWHFIAPPGTLTAQLPEIPNGLGFQTNYPDPPVRSQMGNIRVQDGDDYQAFRNRTLDFVLNPGTALSTGAATSTGIVSPPP